MEKRVECLVKLPSGLLPHLVKLVITVFSAVASVAGLL
jgi:hypothetical protein